MREICGGWVPGSLLVDSVSLAAAGDAGAPARLLAK